MSLPECLEDLAPRPLSVAEIDHRIDRLETSIVREVLLRAAGCADGPAPVPIRPADLVRSMLPFLSDN